MRTSSNATATRNRRRNNRSARRDSLRRRHFLTAAEKSGTRRRRPGYPVRFRAALVYREANREAAIQPSLFDSRVGAGVVKPSRDTGVESATSGAEPVVSGNVGPDPQPTKVLTDRDYQIEATDRVFAEWKKVRSTILLLATGLGKTVCATRIARRVLSGEIGPGGFLFVANRDQLVEQGYETFRLAFPDKVVEIERGRDYASRRAEIVVASVQSLSQPRRLAAFAPDRFAALCVDECDQAVRSNATYAAVYDRFPKAKIVGLTATVDRADELAMNETFDSVAYQYDVLDGIGNGWLCPVGQVYERCEGLDYSTVRCNRDGDFHEGELAAVLKKREPLYAVADAAIKYGRWKGKERKVLIFNASVALAKETADILNEKHSLHGTGRAGTINSKMRKEDREAVLAEYRRGNIKYLTNFGVLGRGFDDDDSRVIVIGRPTRSRSLYAQFVGRILRPLRETVRLLDGVATAEERKALIAQSKKSGALVVDLMGLNHKLVVTMTDLLGGRSSDDAVGAVRNRVAAAAGQPVDVEAELKRAEREAQEAKDRERRSGVVAKANLVGKKVDPFNPSDTVSERQHGWQSGVPISDAQRAALAKFGIPEKELEGMSRGRASKLMEVCISRRKMGLCSYKMSRIMLKFGYDPNLPAEEASKLIEELKANGWKRVG